MRDFHHAKTMAKALRRTLASRDIEITHSEALELVAEQFGFSDWNVLAARIKAEQEEHPLEGHRSQAERPLSQAPDQPNFHPPIPIFRIFSVDKAMEFYRGFLGLALDWEHRFEPNLPLYCQVSRGAMKFHLSEHSGDASPAARAFVPLEGLEAFHAELMSRSYPYMKPGLRQQPWGREVEVVDPFSNRLTFCELEAA